ncbi:MAG: pyridoxal-phosphate dependent enzyme [Candidatus Cloacimonetes bacterium]|nr:pyridoxal-phosphate dependent enzyme [Candidatus Cloacimonadota bacterium]
MAWYRCTLCGAEYSAAETHYLCPLCGQDWHPGQPLKGVLETVYDYEAIGRQFDPQNPDWSLFSPLDASWFPAFPVGKTPLFRSDYFSQNGLDVWIKNDGLNPSGSLKDRASILMVAEARRLGLQEIVCASTGNAASALAACCAAAQITATIFVPASAPRAKRIQMKLCGANVIEVDGDYDAAFDASIQYTKQYGTLNRNTAYHPLTIEGKKTVALEIYAQLGQRVPDFIFVPVGDGVIISAVFKGFLDLLRAQLIQRLPHLVCVQAEGSDAIAQFLESGEFHAVAQPSTIADSISVKVPSNAYLARDAVVQTRGFSVRVSDKAILAAQRELAAKTGVFGEPAAAAAVAGFDVVKEKLPAGSSCVLLITGHGLKDIDAAANALI